MGPVPEEQLRAMLASGDLYWDDLIWREGMADWLPARQVTELVGAPPSPPPPPAKPLPFAIPSRVPIQLDDRPDAMTRAATGPQEVSLQTLEWLRRTKPWVRFLAVLGLVATALSVAAITALGLTAEALPGAPASLVRILPLAAGLFILALHLPPLLLLNRYANRIGRLLRSGATLDLEEALRAQKSFWKYLGILTLVVIILYILGLIAALGMGLIMGGLRH